MPLKITTIKKSNVLELDHIAGMILGTLSQKRPFWI